MWRVVAVLFRVCAGRTASFEAETTDFISTLCSLSGSGRPVTFFNEINNIAHHITEVKLMVMGNSKNLPVFNVANPSSRESLVLAKYACFTIIDVSGLIDNALKSTDLSLNSNVLTWKRTLLLMSRLTISTSRQLKQEREYTVIKHTVTITTINKLHNEIHKHLKHNIT